MLSSFSVSLMTPEKSECFPVCIWKQETVRDFFFFFLSLPFQIESEFAFIIKIMYQGERPWEWYGCRTETVKMVLITQSCCLPVSLSGRREERSISQKVTI